MPWISDVTDPPYFPSEANRITFGDVWLVSPCLVVPGGGVAEAALLSRDCSGPRAFVSLRRPYRNLQGKGKFVAVK